MPATKARNACIAPQLSQYIYIFSLFHGGVFFRPRGNPGVVITGVEITDGELKDRLKAKWGVEIESNSMY